MPRYGMAIDATRCVGCHACRVACQNQNQLPPRESFNRLEEKTQGVFPNYRRGFLPVQCQHCDSPPCVAVCPTGASYKREDGLVLVDRDRCIGCKYCLAACPYNARIITAKGYVDKCRFCIESVEKGEQPACVTTCMVGARVFGDLADPGSAVSRMIRKDHLQPLKAEFNTRPRVYFRKL